MSFEFRFLLIFCVWIEFYRSLPVCIEKVREFFFVLCVILVKILLTEIMVFPIIILSAEDFEESG